MQFKSTVALRIENRIQACSSSQCMLPQLITSYGMVIGDIEKCFVVLCPGKGPGGNILSEGYTSLRQAPHVVIVAGIPLVLATLGFTFLGEGLRDVLDPRGAGRRWA